MPYSGLVGEALAIRSLNPGLPDAGCDDALPNVVDMRWNDVEAALPVPFHVSAICALVPLIAGGVNLTSPLTMPIALPSELTMDVVQFDPRLAR